jgi:hypothetical protein
LFLNVTVPPSLTIAGLGVNAWFPVEPTMETVTLVAVVVVTAVVVVVGAVADGVLLDPPPQLAIATTARARPAFSEREDRMLCSSR